MPKPLGTLLRETWQFCLDHWKPVLIGTLVFTALGVAVNAVVASQAEDRVGSMVRDFNVNEERMEELADRMEAGDTQAMQEFVEEMSVLKSDFQSTFANPQFLKTVSILWAITATLSITIMIFHTLYFTILTLDKSQNAQSIVSKMGPLVLPMFGVWIWAVIRSFMWIPVIGLLFAIVLGPRLIFSGVILVKERLKVTECVRQSHARTKGYWGKIVGNLIILGLLIFIAQAVLGGIVSFLPGHKILFVFVSQLVVAFGSVFLVHLALTVMDHPVVVTRVES